MTHRPVPSTSHAKTQLLHRVVVWGLWMAMLWGLLPFIFGGGIGAIIFWFPGFAKETGIGQEPEGYVSGPGNSYFLLSVYLSLWATCLWTIGGAIVGSVIGYYDQATESKRPWKSKLFREVGFFTFCFWNFFSVLFLTLVFGVLTRLEIIEGYDPQIALLTTFCSLIFSLWISMRNALRDIDAYVKMHSKG